MKNISDFYFDPKISGSFSSVSGFQKNNKTFKNKELDSLKFEDAVNLHKPYINKQIWQADLIDVRKIKFSNSHYGYILTCIDVLSKFAWAVPIKTKTAQSTKIGFEKILASGRKPEKIHVDEGNEFKGECMKYLKNSGIQLYFTNSFFKASIVERFNRTIKNRMYEVMTHRKNKKYTDVLQDLVDSYNKTLHTSIGMKPNQVSEKNEKVVYNRLYKDEQDAIIQIKFRKGDYVRRFKKKDIFSKGYSPNRENDLFIISKIIPRIPPVYKISSINGTEDSRSYYNNELNLAHNINFDTFNVLEEKGEEIQVEKVNNQESSIFWVNKDKFLNQ
jgi:hypothetical protein